MPLFKIARTHLGIRTLFILIRYRLLAIKNRIRDIRRESLFKIVVLLVMGLAFWVGLFLLFLHSFHFLDETAGILHTYLIHYILSLFFFALLVMLVFSNAIIAFSNLFKSTETAFLFALPIRHDIVFLYKLAESLLFSSWAVLAAGVPILLAYGINARVVWYFYPAVAVFILPFVVLPAALGMLVGLVLTAVVPRQRGKILALLFGAVLMFAIYITINVLSVRSAHHFSNNMQMQASIQNVLGRLQFTQHLMTPNFWITEGLLGISENKTDGLWTAAYFLFALFSSAALCVVMGWFLAGLMYETIYSCASVAGHVTKVARNARIESVLSGLRTRYPKIMILMIKDAQTFFRDPAQWSQVLVFFGILALYIGNLRNFSYPLEEPFYQNLISFLNLGATCMTLATITSRFIFPLISLEGRRFWVLGLVPLERRDIMMSKFYFSLCISLLLTTTLILLSNFILNCSTLVLIVQLITGAFISVGLSGLSVGMGAIFPNFNERDPTKIISGFGGTLTLIIAIALVMFSIIGEGLVCHRYLVPRIVKDLADVEYHNIEFHHASIFGLTLMIVVLLNVLAAYVPMRIGIRALERMEL